MLNKYGRQCYDLGYAAASARLREPQEQFADLSKAVQALHPAARDTAGYGEWDAAKWRVFNAAVKLVMESPIGLREPEAPQDVAFATQTSVDGQVPVAAPGTPFNGICPINEQFQSAALRAPQEGETKTS